MAGRQRSPRYPVVDLETALGLLRKLYSKVGRSDFQPDDAATAWGYNSASGPVRSKIATLRQYGLLAGKRGRYAENPRISQRGLSLAGPNPTERELREAALAPPLFMEIFNSMPNATDAVFRRQLVVEKGFTEEGARRFIEGYRATIRFSNLDQITVGSGLEEDAIDDINASEDIQPNTESAPVSQQTGMINMTLSADGGHAELPKGMTANDWKLALQLFVAHRGLVVQDEIDVPAEFYEMFKREPKGSPSPQREYKSETPDPK
ncbi:MAG: hypothetical protein J4G17_02995 [Anaerolineae bacterium]|nr:hypothetical protein [Anaerolineae bacterium]